MEWFYIPIPLRAKNFIFSFSGQEIQNEMRKCIKVFYFFNFIARFPKGNNSIFIFPFSTIMAIKGIKTAAFHLMRQCLRNKTLIFLALNSKNTYIHVIRQNVQCCISVGQDAVTSFNNGKVRESELVSSLD